MAFKNEASFEARRQKKTFQKLNEHCTGNGGVLIDLSVSISAGVRGHGTGPARPRRHLDPLARPELGEEHSPLRLRRRELLDLGLDKVRVGDGDWPGIGVWRRVSPLGDVVGVVGLDGDHVARGGLQGLDGLHVGGELAVRLRTAIRGAIPRLVVVALGGGRLLDDLLVGGGRVVGPVGRGRVGVYPPRAAEVADVVDQDLAGEGLVPVPLVILRNKHSFFRLLGTPRFSSTPGSVAPRTLARNTPDNNSGKDKCIRKD